MGLTFNVDYTLKCDGCNETVKGTKGLTASNEIGQYGTLAVPKNVDVAPKGWWTMWTSSQGTYAVCSVPCQTKLGNVTPTKWNKVE